MEQEYTGPDGSTHTRHGILARVRVEDFEAGPILPHERTLPGPKAGPARTDAGDPLQPLADLLAEHAGPLAAGRTRNRVEDAWGEATDAAGTVTRSGGSRNPEIHEDITERPRRRPAADRRRPPPLRDRDRLPRRDRRRGPAQLHADGADRPRRPRPLGLPHPPPALRLRRRPRAPAPPRRGPARALRGDRGRPTTASTRLARRASASSASTTPTTSAPSACGSRTQPSSTGRSTASPRPTAASTRRSSRPWC